MPQIPFSNFDNTVVQRRDISSTDSEITPPLSRPLQHGVRQIVFVLFTDDRGRLSGLYELSFVNDEKNIIELYNQFRQLHIITHIGAQVTLIYNPHFDELKNDPERFRKLHEKIINWKDCSSYFTADMYMLDIVRKYSKDSII